MGKIVNEYTTQIEALRVLASKMAIALHLAEGELTVEELMVLSVDHLNEVPEKPAKAKS